MDAKDKYDLHNPTPIPKTPPPPAPEPPAPKPEPPVKKNEPKKKRGGLLVGVAVAGVLLAGYRFIHFWSDATCTALAKCSICGLEQGDYAEHTWARSSCDEPMTCSVCGAVGESPAGHSWTGGSCTEPGVCSVCGEVQETAPGHTYQDGVCTVCGAEQTNEVVKWEPGDYAQVGYSYQSDTRAISIDAASWENLTKMVIVIRNCENRAVSTDGYTVERLADAVVVNLPRNLEPGRYTIRAGVQETKVLDFWWGTCGTWILEDTDKWFADFETKNYQHGQWLAGSDEGAPLRGVQTEEEATRFASPWQMSGADYDDEGYAVLMQGGAKQKFVMDQYLRIDGSGTEETAYTIRFGDWYLTMDADGTVFLTDTLDDGGFWVITSSL